MQHAAGIHPDGRRPQPTRQGPGPRAPQDGHEHLAELRERYDRLVEQAPDAILIHVGGRITLANTAACVLAGADPCDGLIGRNINEFLRPPYLKAVQKLLVTKAGEPRTLIIPDVFRRLDGTEIAVDVTAIPFVDHDQPAAHLVIRDISERDEARAAELLAASQLTLLLDHLPAMIWTTDLDRQVTSVLGAHPRTLPDWLRPDADPTVQAAEERAIQGHRVDLELERDGHALEVHIEPLEDAHAARIGSLGMARDVTTRKRDEALRQTAQKTEAIGQLAGGVAHEVNNMMMVVLGFAEEMLANQDLGAPYRQDLQEIQKAARHAAEVTAQLLAFGRRGRFQPVPSPVDLLCKGLAPMLRQLLGPTRPLVYQLDCGRRVRCDVQQFQQIIVNLVINARDAMPDGGTLMLATSAERLHGILAHDGRTIPDGEYAILRVSDQGIGIESGVLEHIFEPFFTTKPQGQGTGLGLSAFQGIMARNGGYFRVESEPGCGTTFWMYLPLLPEDAVAIAPPAGPEPARAQLPTGFALLVVGRDPVLRAVVSRGLTHRGFRVTEADGADTALALARDLPLDAILIDAGADDTTEDGLMTRLKAARADLPIVCVPQRAPYDPEDQEPLVRLDHLAQRVTEAVCARRAAVLAQLDEPRAD